MTYSYRDQLEIVSKIRLKPNQTRRVDCPFCSGKNTFTISRVDGSVVWNCYKASCGSRGNQNVGRSLQEIGSRLDRSSGGSEGARSGNSRSVAIPELLTSIRGNERAEHYLRSSHCEFAERAGLATIRYSPTEDRVMFKMPDRDGHEDGWVGRSLDRSMKPKWKMYGDCSGIFLCGTSPHLVLVEDAASACAVSQIGQSGGALLGTNLSPYQKSLLKRFETVIVALDKDASQKAIKIRDKLQGLVPTTVRFLDEDLKYLEPKKIKEIIDGTV